MSLSGVLERFLRGDLESERFEGMKLWKILQILNKHKHLPSGSSLPLYLCRICSFLSTREVRCTCKVFNSRFYIWIMAFDYSIIYSMHFPKHSLSQRSASSLQSSSVSLEDGVYSSIRIDGESVIGCITTRVRNVRKLSTDTGMNETNLERWDPDCLVVKRYNKYKKLFSEAVSTYQIRSPARPDEIISSNQA